MILGWSREDYRKRGQKGVMGLLSSKKRGGGGWTTPLDSRIQAGGWDVGILPAIRNGMFILERWEGGSLTHSGLGNIAS